METFGFGLVEGVARQVDDEFDGGIRVILLVIRQNRFGLLRPVHHGLDHRLFEVLKRRDGRPRAITYVGKLCAFSHRPSQKTMTACVGPQRGENEGKLTWVQTRMGSSVISILEVFVSSSRTETSPLIAYELSTKKQRMTMSGSRFNK